MPRILSALAAALLLDRALARLALHTLSTPDALASVALIAACVLFAAGAWEPAPRSIRRPPLTRER